MEAIDFYNAKATNIVNVPRVDHPEDPSGIAGVRRCMEARYFAEDALVMSLADACQFAEAYRAALAATHPQPQKCERSLTIRYTNYRGETSDRSIEPGRIYFGSTEWHPEEQWLLEAFDFDRKAGRTFALKDIQWKTKAYASSREQK